MGLLSQEDLQKVKDRVCHHATRMTTFSRKVTDNP